MDADALQHFWSHGWVRVERAFSSEAASRMRDAVWRGLAVDGIERNRPVTWTVERPTHLRSLKGDPIFQHVGSARLKGTLDAIFEGVAYDMPKDWGAFFVAFPTTEAWRIPSAGWHIDTHYCSTLRPTLGVKTHALLGDVGPRGGGSLLVSGSHRLVHNWFKAHPPPRDARSADMRKQLLSHPYIGELHAPGDAQKRITRFMERSEVLDDIPLQVVENTGSAGDVIVVHPLVLHVAAPNNAREPRFLLSGGITTDQWGWLPT
jgi:hypothetical protein